MKKILLTLVLTITLIFTGFMQSFAADYSELPGGKNYIDYSNIVENSSSSWEIGDSITVKSNTTYTLTMPFYRAQEFFEIDGEEGVFYVTGNSGAIISEFLDSGSWTVLDEESDSRVSYTFNTGSNTSITTIEMSLSTLFYQYASDNGGYWQLEEGSTSTSYEAYIEPADTEAPVQTLVGSSVIYLEYSETYTEQGSTCSDNVDLSCTSVITGSVDTSTLGTYIVRYNATDAAGNVSPELTRTVYVRDTTDPVVSLIGSSVIYVEYGDDYTELNSTWTDNYDETVVRGPRSGSVDVDTFGTYLLYYGDEDSSGNQSNTAIRTVYVRDTTDPDIDLNGSSVIYVEFGNDYTELGATFTDNHQESLQTSISGSVNIGVLGSYTITYFASDYTGNETTVTRTVIVRDTTDPVIELNGAATIYVEIGDDYTELGAVFNDVHDGTGSAIITGTVDTNILGTYTIDYDYTDITGNAATTVSRTVIVQDTIGAVNTLTGDSVIYVEFGDSYTELGATWVDGGSSGDSFTDDTVDVNTLGSYTIYYYVDASKDITTRISRTVIVRDTTSPVLTLVGDATISIEIGTVYTDDGATWIDNYDGSGTLTIYSVNDVYGTSVDVNTIGTYIVKYRYDDTEGNPGNELTRTVNVTPSTDTSQTLNGDSTVYVEYGDEYNELGAAWINIYGSGVSEANGSVDTDTLGSYTIYYYEPYVLEQLVDNGDFSSGVLSPLTSNGVDTPVISNGIITYTSTLENGRISFPYVVEANISYLFTAWVKADSPLVSINFGGSSTGKVSHSGSGEWELLTGIYTRTSDLSAGFYFGYDSRTSGWTEIELKNIMVIPITDTEFENLTTSEISNILLDVEYFEGEENITNLGIVPAGKNILGVEFEYGYYESTDGTKKDDTSNRYIRTKDLIEIEPNTNYIVSSDLIFNISYGVNAVYFDEYYNYIGSGNIGNGITTPANAKYIVFQFRKIDITTITPSELDVANTFTQLEEGSVSTSYEEYSSIPIVDTEYIVRSVIVRDTTHPVIALNGESTVYIEYGDDYTELGAIANDNYDPDVAADISGEIVNINSIGTYYVSYTWTDTSGNIAQEEVRTVIVRDTTEPVQTLVGNSVIYIEYGEDYTEQGATWIDNFDGEGISEVIGTVDTSVLGAHDISYTYEDTFGNMGNLLTRVVYIQDTTSPVINLNGSDTIYLELGETYTELGAVFTDNHQESLQTSISGDVDVNTIGTYTVTYDVTDYSGNEATDTRTVIVSAAPVVVPVIPGVDNAPMIGVIIGAAILAAAAYYFFFRKK